ncbi:MAG: spore maturation protein A [Eubacteriales bacterium]|nr:spore maturation protein A [Eubacteriales bacterium]
MAITVLLLALYLLSAWTALAAGQAPAAGAAMLAGTGEAVRFSLELCGGVCLWSSVLELLERCGLAGQLARLLRPLLQRLFPHAAREEETLAALTENLSANLLGLGNAATPAGIRAAQGLARLGTPARDELCLLVVLNTASLQILPASIASLRAAAGAAAPFDILPAVWFSTLCSLTAGLGSAALLRRVWP